MPVANVAHNEVLVAHKRVDIDRVWYSLQSFLIAFANISKISGSKNKQTESSMKIKVLGVCSSTCEASYSTGALNLTRELV